MNKLKKALEKARSNRDDVQRPEVSIENKQLYEDNFPTPEALKKKQREEIEFLYDDTRVEKVSKKMFWRNRIVSLFPEKKGSEQFKKIRTQVLSRFDSLNANTLLITSARPSEGKTFSSINLGISIAQEFDRTVLIMDADLKKPHSNHKDFARDFFGVKSEKGLSDFLKKKAELPELLINPGIERLTFLPAGKPLLNSSELLGSPRMESLMDDIKSRYQTNRFIIIDTPAVLEWTDAVVLSRYADGVVLVVEQEKTRQADVKQMIELFKSKPIIGTIMNKSRV
jgi:non-specific protein-tyrosine kinase